MSVRVVSCVTFFYSIRFSFIWNGLNHFQASTRHEHMCDREMTYLQKNSFGEKAFVFTWLFRLFQFQIPLFQKIF